MNGKNNDYAVSESGGRQHYVVVGAQLELDKPGITEISKVLLVKSGEKVLIGAPYLKDAKIELGFAGEKKARKVISFKKKRRKGYRRKIGHRQKYFLYEVKNINLGV